MALTDLLGILSLLLAVGGGAYLVWARLLRAAPGPVLSEPESPPRDRSADTIPPTLRPQSEISPKMVAKLARSGQPRCDLTTNSVLANKPGGSEPPKAISLPPTSKGAHATASDLLATDVYPSSNEIATLSSEKPPESDPLPRFDSEEDEELEPTKMGAAAATAPIQPVVEKIIFDEGADAPPEGTAPNVAVQALGQTDPGKRRKQNQDAFLVLPKASVFVVADGMGGHRGGQTASRLAVKMIRDAFEKKQFDAAPHPNIPLEASELARSIQMANTAIFQEAQNDRDLAGMGTTLCAARFTEDNRRLFIGHVGDSRCYRLRDGVMKQMTSDHTMADYGVTGPEGAHLSRALGVWPTVPIDLVMAIPKLGDIYLICSDGLTKMIPDSTITTQLAHEEDPKAAVERLIFFANSHGGKDNVTVVLLHVVEPPRVGCATCSVGPDDQPRSGGRP